MEGDEYELANGYVVTKCYDDYPPVFFLFDEKWVGVYPDEYVVDISDRQDRSLCVLLMTEGDQPFFVFGLPIYMDYYTVHDAENNRIGFVPHSESDKAPLSPGFQPNRIFESESPEPYPVSTWSWVISSLLVCCCCCIIGEETYK